jgi:hypothetical protein
MHRMQSLPPFAPKAPGKDQINKATRPFEFILRPAGRIEKGQDIEF